MDIGIALLMTQHDFNTTDLARKVEEFGFESLWAPEHGIVPIDFKVAPATGRQGGIPKFYAEGGINQTRVVTPDGVIERREIETGMLDGAYVEIVSGVSPGEYVILEIDRR